jgi:DNA gyrase/topoisomerase IV subunit A
MTGPARGVIFMKIRDQAEVVGLETIAREDSIRFIQNDQDTKVVQASKIQLSTRGGRGKKLCSRMVGIERDV